MPLTYIGRTSRTRLSISECSDTVSTVLNVLPISRGLHQIEKEFGVQILIFPFPRAGSVLFLGRSAEILFLDAQQNRNNHNHVEAPH